MRWPSFFFCLAASVIIDVPAFLNSALRFLCLSLFFAFVASLYIFRFFTGRGFGAGGGGSAGDGSVEGGSVEGGSVEGGSVGGVVGRWGFWKTRGCCCSGCGGEKRRGCSVLGCRNCYTLQNKHYENAL